MEKIPSDTTNRNIMKIKLGMSYRLFDKKHKKSIKNEGSINFIQACALQIELIIIIIESNPRLGVFNYIILLYNGSPCSARRAGLGEKALKSRRSLRSKKK